ncbi:DHHC palmitoyltransferase-domain-containing protein [Fimicolochytrium jonesii]|uniref:DHHC palmitoyltransferase-domain-containing protein n=1 Tax=Fimicolochytrium jonesii TaxID=1396493 RepID=UPI0022FE8868|nr:DHHC palmitoyltransferase-domain-containing protein [Fimicolochytrium jonesii]KAI8819122.1 DHHC palmitoyltransferase-domain-containing protein [Fimicolochytrium jonesii]
MGRNRGTDDRSGDALFAITAVTLLTSLPLLSQLFVFLPWLRPLTFGSTLVLGVFDLVVILAIVNGIACRLTDPGRVPSTWSSPPPTQPTADLPSSTYCHKCNIGKPPRTHHCRRCERCVLRMDHHCKWLNTCIGHGNQPHFIRFLLFTVLSTLLCALLLLARLLSLVLSIIHFIHTDQKHTQAPGLGEITVMAVVLCVLVPVGSILGMMLYQQVMESRPKNLVFVYVH